MRPPVIWSASSQAGVDAVQIFDTWAGVLPPEEFARWCIEPAQRIVDAGAQPRCRAPRSSDFRAAPAPACLRYVEEVPVDAVGLDWMVDPTFARDQIQSRVPVQGNLDPLALLAGGVGARSCGR